MTKWTSCKVRFKPKLLGSEGWGYSWVESEWLFKKTKKQLQWLPLRMKVKILPVGHKKCPIGHHCLFLTQGITTLISYLCSQPAYSHSLFYSTGNFVTPQICRYPPTRGLLHLFFFCLESCTSYPSFTLQTFVKYYLPQRGFPWHYLNSTPTDLTLPCFI